MQKYKEINGNDYVKNSRTTINETMQSIQSMNSGTAFPTNNLFEGMKCYRTDLKKTYTLTDVENNTWVEDAHATLSDEATHAASATKLQTPRALNLSGAVTADAASFDGTADATINVKTLDASKLKGTASVSTTGNAATATKLATARTIALSGNATGSTTFDGSGNATINATVNESAHAATATKVVTTAANGASANIAEATMASSDFARIRVSGASDAGELALETADNGDEAIVARQYTGDFKDVARTASILDTNGNTSFPGTVVAPKFTGTLNGNAATASKLASPRTISLTGKAAGSTSFDGSSNAAINVTSVNADTASKLSTARKINITGNATGVAAFDGSGDVSINTTVNESKHAAAADKATQDTNGRAFTDTNAYMHISALANGTDFNNVKTTGVYTCIEDSYPNRPRSSWGVLRVYLFGNNVKQEYIPDNTYEVWERYYFSGGSWNAWSKVAASTADSATTADSLNEISDRPASANVTYNDGKIRYFLATNSMSEGKPSGGDGPVMHLSWDRPNWESQIAFNNPSGHIQTRTQDNGTWGSWKTVLDSSNYNSYVPTKTGGGASGTWNINISGTATNATKATTAAACTGNSATASRLATARSIALTGNATGSAAFDGSGNISISTNVNTASNADKLDGHHASDIINRITAANTGGIVAASLTANGYVKFANGLILQWGKRTNNENDWGNFNVSLPIAFSSTPLSAQVTVGGTWTEKIECSVVSVNKTTLQICYRSDANHYAFWTAVGI